MMWDLLYVLGYLILYVVLFLHVLHTKFERSDEAMMWLFVITLLPGVGWLFYLFFGIIRLKRTNENLIRAFAIEEQCSAKVPEAQLQWQQLSLYTPDISVLNNRFNATLNRLFPRRIALSGNHVELLQDGVKAYPRMLEDIANAKHCIRLESFIITDDQIGQEFLNLLKRKADEGVDVKILFDSFGSFGLAMSHLFRRLSKKHKNFAIQAFSPLNLLAPWKFQLRNHRKLLVIDGSVAYCGGINISEGNERLKSVPKSRYIHDLHCRITGPAVAYYTCLFIRDWWYTMRRHRSVQCVVAGDFPPLEATGNTTLRVMDSDPADNRGGSEKLFFTAAAVCQKSLFIMTPYFVPGEDYINALIMAAARGVDVRVIVPANNNHHFVDWASRSFFPSLLAGGVRIFERRGIFSHTKALLADHEWGFMGSSNCDNRSFQLNFELDFCFEGEEFVSDMSKQFTYELDRSREIQLYDLNQGYFYQLRGHLCALLAPIL